MKALLSSPVLQTTVRSRVAAHELVRGSAEQIAQWRRQPIALGGEKLPAALLKHAEDQTVAGVTAVVHALDRQGWCRRSFADWGVIAAPNLFGRITNAQAIERFRREGAWGVSPQMIPHQSLHAMSGTLSQILKIYGPNLGVGGGPNASLEAFLVAAALLADGGLPGLWIVLTGYESEWIPAANGQQTQAPACIAAALALTPGEPKAGGMFLSIGQAPCAADLALVPELQLSALADEWDRIAQTSAGRWRLSDTHWLEFLACASGWCDNNIPSRSASEAIHDSVAAGDRA